MLQVPGRAINPKALISSTISYSKFKILTSNCNKKRKYLIDKRKPSVHIIQKMQIDRFKNKIIEQSISIFSRHKKLKLLMLRQEMRVSTPFKVNHHKYK